MKQTKYMQRESDQVKKLKRAIEREQFFKNVTFGVCVALVASCLIWALLQ